MITAEQDHRDCYPPWHGGCQHGEADCPANFPEHEHAGDVFDPAHCVWTREDGERCMKPLGFEGLAQRMTDRYSTYVRQHGHQHKVSVLVADLINMAVAVEGPIRSDERAAERERLATEVEEMAPRWNDYAVPRSRVRSVVSFIRGGEWW